MTTRLGQVMAGCVVLVTADRRSGELASALIRRGATVRHAPRGAGPARGEWGPNAPHDSAAGVSIRITS